MISKELTLLQLRNLLHSRYPGMFKTSQASWDTEYINKYEYYVDNVRHEAAFTTIPSSYDVYAQTSHSDITGNMVWFSCTRCGLEKHEELKFILFETWEEFEELIGIGGSPDPYIIREVDIYLVKK